ncbi:Retrovirus-related Pol polyprotein from transposon 297 [Vitis vinifera]|uniref:Retrovirus-related Pol polyprotein from transposon 297 n=1 Tax=Vitis vinifera TaxID=29760 RepID=A0A438GZZ9_VITVI|nr:Retrovirus-related Pol polyprotein from transposon 297 [Vitis vinifera]
MYTKLFSLKQGTKSIEEYTEEFHELSIRNQVRESDAQLAARYKARLRMEIQLEMIAADTYTVDDVYQLALKIEEGLKFRVSRCPSSQIGSTFSNKTTSKPLSTSNFKTSNHVNGGGNTQQTSNVSHKNEPKSELESTQRKKRPTMKMKLVKNVTTMMKVEEFKEQDKEYPTNVHKILDDFSDLWPVELPNQLSPMRDVQHAIDLIPGASLPNLPAYRMNPIEHAELKRQVDELLTKGFIRESLSPCGVSTLLTPKKDGSWQMCVDSRVLKPFIGRFVVVYFDDILIYSRSCEDHEEHLKQGFEIDPKKIKAIVDWPVPTNIHEVRSFHGMATFYRRFIRNFNSIMAPITECMKPGLFIWTKMANKAFEEIKSKMVNPYILRLLDFEKVFEAACDASHVGIGAVLSQEGHPVAFFSAKLNGAKKNTPHMILNSMPWCKQLGIGTLSQLQGIENKVVDVLSRKALLLVNMSATTIGFEELKHCYDNDVDFGDVDSSLLSGSKATRIDFQILEVYLFYKNSLCLPRTSLRDHVIWELHGGGMGGHFG